MSGGIPAHGGRTRAGAAGCGPWGRLMGGWWRCGARRGLAAVVAGAGLCAASALRDRGRGHRSPPRRRSRRDRGAERTDAPRLKTGETYRSSLGTRMARHRLLQRRAGRRRQRVRLRRRRLPLIRCEGDVLGRHLRDAGRIATGNRCDAEHATFRSRAYPRPIAAVAERLVRSGGLRCQTAGTYYVVVERKADAESTRGPWGLG